MCRKSPLHALAEALDNKEIDNRKAHTLFAGTAANDHAKIRELVRILMGIKHPGVTREEFQEYLTKIDQELYDRAAKLVQRHNALIVDLAEHGMKLLDEALNSGALLNDLELPLADLEKFTDLEERLRKVPNQGRRRRACWSKLVRKSPRIGSIRMRLTY